MLENKHLSDAQPAWAPMIRFSGFKLHTIRLCACWLPFVRQNVCRIALNDDATCFSTNRWLLEILKFFSVIFRGNWWKSGKNRDFFAEKKFQRFWLIFHDFSSFFSRNWQFSTNNSQSARLPEAFGTFFRAWLNSTWKSRFLRWKIGF